MGAAAGAAAELAALPPSSLSGAWGATLVRDQALFCGVHTLGVAAGVMLFVHRLDGTPPSRALAAWALHAALARRFVARGYAAGTCVGLLECGVAPGSALAGSLMAGYALACLLPREP